MTIQHATRPANDDRAAAAPGTADEAATPTAGAARPTLWNVVTGLIAGLAGLAPHVLHHIGLVAGAFLVTGATGNLVFGTLGLVLSIPLLRRLHARFGTWRAPAVAVAVFAVMFSISAFVLGPAISGSDAPPPAPGQDIAPGDHADHHG